jgi:hypothetical protein
MGFSFKFVITLAGVFVLCAPQASLAITKLGNCRAELDGGKILDLSSLDNAKKPL